MALPSPGLAFLFSSLRLPHGDQCFGGPRRYGCHLKIGIVESGVIESSGSESGNEGSEHGSLPPVTHAGLPLSRPGLGFLRAPAGLRRPQQFGWTSCPPSTGFSSRRVRVFGTPGRLHFFGRALGDQGLLGLRRPRIFPGSLPQCTSPLDFPPSFHASGSVRARV